MEAAWTSAQIGGMSASDATPQTKRRCSFFKSDIEVVDVEVGGIGWGAVVMAAVTPCVADRTAAATMAAISRGDDGPGMVAAGGGAGVGARNVPCGVVHVGVSTDPLVGVQVDGLGGRALGVSSAGSGVKRVRAGVMAPAPDASKVVGVW